MSESTTLELGAVEAIKRGHRTIREAVRIIATHGEDASDGSIELSNRAFVTIAAVSPLLEALTGLTPQRQVEAAFKRLEEDGTIGALMNRRGCAEMILAIADRT